MRRLAFVTLLVGALLTGSALAGGTQVNVAATGGRVWLTTGSDVVELDSTSGRIVRRVRTRYPFPIELGVSDGAVWVSSVENGFVSGGITRIPFESSRRATSPLVLPRRPVLSLAVGSGATWALVGPWQDLRLARIDQATRHASSRPIRHDVAWLAADNTGETPGAFGVTQRGTVLRVDRKGAPRTVATVPAGSGPPAVGLGSVWVPSGSAVYRVDPSGRRAPQRLEVPGIPQQAAIGGGAVWLVTFAGTANGKNRFELLRIDATRLRITGRRRLPGTTGGIAYGNGAVWLGRAVPSTSVLRVSPKTLQLRVFATVL